MILHTVVFTRVGGGLNPIEDLEFHIVDVINRDLGKGVRFHDPSE